MDAREVSSRLEELYVLDVRDPHEWQAGRIEGSIHLPLMQVPLRIAELPRDRTIVCVCKVGARSAEAAWFLTRQGYDAQNLEGGVVAWTRAGLPLTTPAGAPGIVA